MQPRMAAFKQVDNAINSGSRTWTGADEELAIQLFWKVKKALKSIMRTVEALPHDEIERLVEGAMQVSGRYMEVQKAIFVHLVLEVEQAVFDTFEERYSQVEARVKMAYPSKPPQRSKDIVVLFNVAATVKPVYDKVPCT